MNCLFSNSERLQPGLHHASVVDIKEDRNYIARFFPKNITSKHAKNPHSLSHHWIWQTNQRFLIILIFFIISAGFFCFVTSYILDRSLRMFCMAFAASQQQYPIKTRCSFSPKKIIRDFNQFFFTSVSFSHLKHSIKIYQLVHSKQKPLWRVSAIFESQANLWSQMTS